MVKYLASLLLLAFAVSANAQTKTPAQTKPAKSATTPAKQPAKATTAVVLKPENEPAFCPEFKKVLAAAPTNFDALKGDTIRKTKSIIIASKISLPGLAANRISYDRSINQTFYRGFLEGTGNLSVVKQKFDGIKAKIKACLNGKWVEKNKETETKTAYTRLFILSENPQNAKTKEYKGTVIEIEVEYEIGTDTEYDISITIANYK